MNSTVTSIDALASSGHTVMTGDDEDILEIVKLAIDARRSVSFYLTRAQADLFLAWFWTPERILATGVEPISDAERLRIKSELGLELARFHYAPMKCQHCSRNYGAFEFMRQGVIEHGSEVLRSVFSMENAMLLQVNPKLVPICPDCGNSLGATGEVVSPAGFYFGSGYAACII